MRSTKGFCPSPEYTACKPAGTEGGKVSWATIRTVGLSSPSTCASQSVSSPTTLSRPPCRQESVVGDDTDCGAIISFNLRLAPRPSQDADRGDSVQVRLFPFETRILSVHGAAFTDRNFARDRGFAGTLVAPVYPIAVLNARGGGCFTDTGPAEFDAAGA